MARRTHHTEADLNPVEREQRRREAEQAANDLRWVMSEEQGRRFIWALLGRCGTFSLSYTGNADTNFNEGKRAIGTDLYARLHTHCLDQYLVMMREAQQKEDENG